MSANAQRFQLGPFFYNGAIQGGAKLYHFAAGTSTLKDMWSERDQDPTVAQPLVADANGIFNGFADGLYKIVICRPESTGASDLVLYTLDDWHIVDVESDLTMGEGALVNSASTIVVGPDVWAHIGGTTNIDVISGTIPFFWAVFDGALTLNHSASLILPEAQNRKVRVGEVCFFLYEGSGVYRLAGYWLPAKQTDIASAATITAPTHGSLIDLTGTTDIVAITASYAGHEFLARCTNAAGLNINHSSSLLTPWGFDYRVYQNEIVKFTAVTSAIWALSLVTGPSIPVGCTIEDNSATPLAGFLEEDGAAISRADYSGLFARISTLFGVGDGSTTFNKPDSRGRVALNVDGAANRITAASTNGGNADTLGGVGGAETHTLAESEVPTMNVAVDSDAHSNGAVSVGGSNGASDSSINNAASGGSGAHSNTQPWIAKKKYIRF
jgi:microcystin-dependent protein